MRGEIESFAFGDEEAEVVSLEEYADITGPYRYLLESAFQWQLLFVAALIISGSYRAVFLLLLIPVQIATAVIVFLDARFARRSDEEYKPNIIVWPLVSALFPIGGLFIYGRRRLGKWWLVGIINRI